MTQSTGLGIAVSRPVRRSGQMPVISGTVPPDRITLGRVNTIAL